MRKRMRKKRKKDTHKISTDKSGCPFFASSVYLSVRINIGGLGMNGGR